ncbi:MAG: cox cluster protein [Haloquadratum sp.]
MTDADAADADGRNGSRFVLRLYAALVGVSALAGALTGVFVDGLRPPRFLFVIPFPATPLGFAAYGGLTVALALGVPLALVVYVSRELDAAAG